MFLWVWNMVSHFKGATPTEGVSEDSGENLEPQGENNRRLKNIG
jgi:hypothetical protein